MHLYRCDGTKEADVIPTFDVCVFITVLAAQYIVIGPVCLFVCGGSPKLTTASVQAVFASL